MKHLFLIALTLFSVTANAHEIVSIKKATNPILEKFRVYAEANCKENEQFTACNTYFVKTISPKKDDETATQTYYRVIKASLHRDFPITGDDGGYSFGSLTKGATQVQVEKFVNSEDYFSGIEQEGSKKLSTLVKAATDAGLIAFIGSGTGNNTASYILTLVDPATRQFSYLMMSNFGSDN